MVARLVVQTVLWLAGMGVLLFGAAGTLAWPAAWWFLIELGVLSLWVGLWLARHDPALLAERLAPFVQKQQSRWDRLFMMAVACVWCGWLTAMGLDAMRFRWSAPLPVALMSLGSLCVLACIAMCRFVFAANSYAAPVVKIQAGRGHKVVDSGPYAHVRHPMYSAALLFFVGTPLLLGSWWGLAFVPVMVIGLGWRAVREEQVLAAHLSGYAAYMARVRFRFVPFIW
ncbi:methyltransferase family protein [Paraburkholderia phenoliruptrix]|uniref:methyltransferase family protein n=1 Tax=Paraburkholderia phenoliruptrix TaxID=252970 RepID=UPI001C6F0BE1|nr:isoprenylcysteine carboxylmethyltransferase family protein [Paraburkholderia phenoliruptrix]MBW9104810.1 isoprenylcysteine carboxylmethyltransferase family protein [Paraburkholderia phenoliruptrix]MBW9132773.1 isoprenylcysteine carboxylmethyltransferase family protein [Paraburkholderia ginsengiterrae]